MWPSIRRHRHRHHNGAFAVRLMLLPVTQRTQMHSKSQEPCQNKNKK